MFSTRDYPPNTARTKKHSLAIYCKTGENGLKAINMTSLVYIGVGRSCAIRNRLDRHARSGRPGGHETHFFDWLVCESMQYVLDFFLACGAGAASSGSIEHFISEDTFGTKLNYATFKSPAHPDVYMAAMHEHSGNAAEIAEKFRRRMHRLRDVLLQSRRQQRVVFVRYEENDAAFQANAPARRQLAAWFHENYERCVLVTIAACRDVAAATTSTAAAPACDNDVVVFVPWVQHTDWTLDGHDWPDIFGQIAVRLPRPEP
jgi:hypothetical protein